MVKINDVESEFDISYSIAKIGHAGQVDASGKPYIGHINAVIAGVNTEKEKACAALHDLLEDCPDWDADRLYMEGISEEVVKAVIAMTKVKGESYDDYLVRVKANPIARKVKLSDLAHNMDLSRLPKVTDYALKRQEKYKKAVEFLKG